MSVTNCVVLIGRTTKDVDFKEHDETKVARFSLAVPRKHSTKDEADFINCVAFSKTAEFINKYVPKGTKIVVLGEIRTGSYTNKEGKKVYTTDVFVNEVEFAQSKGQEQPKASDEGFMDIPEGIEESLPFK